MKLQTPVELLSLKNTITYKDKVLFMGSCFATEVGNIMKSLQFDVMLNPFGVLYNPASICSSLKRLTNCEPFKGSDIICSQGLYTSFFHHSTFSKGYPTDFLENANEALSIDAKNYAKSQWSIITLGTAWVFRHIEKNIIVSNCHKIEEKEFKREFLETEEIVEMFNEIIASRKDKKWIFTVSPIRHLKDGAHGNQLSKATLLLAIDKLQKKNDNVYYFPAYEIMMDELRDYRFYTEGMTHPTPQAVKYIFEKFMDFAINKSEYPQMKVAEKQFKSNLHIVR
ncbi:MAG: GSCFA domain-containing protein [Bacteroidales bacterium]|jgi:hypothetical protein